MIDSVVIKQVYLGDGVTTHFPYPFSFISSDDVKVAIYDIPTEIETQLTSDYFVDTVAEEVIYPGYSPGEEPPESEQPPVLPDTQKLIVYRSTPLSQLEDLGEKYPLPIIEEMVDKVTMITQELSEKIGRALVIEMGASITPQEFLESFREGVATAVEKAGEASASATAASNSATAAGNSAAAAALSETAAGNSATAANNSKIAAAASETAAGNSATAAGNSATAAYNSQVAAAASETAAGNSATAAGTSATNAGNSATAAGNSATAAHNSQVAAKASEDAAAQSAAEAAGINYLVRKNSTTYAEGVVAFYQTIPSPLVLECTTAGTTASTAPDFSGAAEGDTITDGTVVWTYKSILSGGGVQVGFIMPYAGTGLQEGWLDCDGSAVSRTMYPALFAAIGTTWGAGDGSATFNLPRSEDLVLQGASATNPVGTYLSAGLPNIEGATTADELTGFSVTARPDCFSDDGKALFFTDISATDIPTSGKSLTGTSGSGTSSAAINIDASRASAIYGNSDTVQPPAACVRYMIKAFDGQTSDSALIDITQYAADLANKATRSLDNLTAAGEARFAHVVIDSYYDSTTGDWWREYADGWIEQGGVVQYSASTQIINLFKPLQLRYHCQITAESNPNDGGNTLYMYSCSALTTTSFTVTNASSSTQPYRYIVWLARGFSNS